MPLVCRFNIFAASKRGQTDRARRADNDLGELLPLNVIEDLQNRREAQPLQFVFRQFEFADRPEILDRDIVDLQIPAGGDDDQFFPGGHAGRRHFANGGSDAVHVFERVGEPGALSILQRRRNGARHLQENLREASVREGAWL